MKIQGEEFNNGEIVFIKYKTMFGKIIDYAGFFIEKVLFFNFGISKNYPNTESYDKGFKVKRVISIRKLI